jgi:hypothetical protein
MALFYIVLVYTWRPSLRLPPKTANLPKSATVSQGKPLYVEKQSLYYQDCFLYWHSGDDWLERTYPQGEAETNPERECP